MPLAFGVVQLGFGPLKVFQFFPSSGNYSKQKLMMIINRRGEIKATACNFKKGNKDMGGGGPILRNNIVIFLH